MILRQKDNFTFYVISVCICVNDKNAIFLTVTCSMSYFVNADGEFSTDTI